jgi:hypothetical protein
VRTKPVLQRRRNRSQVVLKTDVYIAAYLLPPGKPAKLGSTERLNQAVPFTLSSFATLPGRAGALYRMPPPLPNRFVGGYTGSAPTAGSRGKTQGTRKAFCFASTLFSVSLILHGSKNGVYPSVSWRVQTGRFSTTKTRAIPVRAVSTQPLAEVPLNTHAEAMIANAKTSDHTIRDVPGLLMGETYSYRPQRSN